MSQLGLLASLAPKDDEPADDESTESAVESEGAGDDSDLIGVMDEFRSAKSSKAALASLRALIRSLNKE